MTKYSTDIMLIIMIIYFRRFDEVLMNSPYRNKKRELAAAAASASATGSNVHAGAFSFLETHDAWRRHDAHTPHHNLYGYANNDSKI